MDTIAEVASHDYAAAALEHKRAEAVALRKARLFERQSAIAVGFRREATAQLTAGRALEQRAVADAHLKAAELLYNASAWEART